MASLKRASVFVSLLSVMALYLSPAHAAIETTDKVVGNTDRAQLTTLLQREDVQEELINMGVNPSDALARVSRMTDEEVVEMNSQIAKLPVGAGGHLSTVQVLLIILLIVILV